MFKRFSVGLFVQVWAWGNNGSGQVGDGAACPPGTPADATPPLLRLEEPTDASLTSVRPPL